MRQWSALSTTLVVVLVAATRVAAQDRAPMDTGAYRAEVLAVQAALESGDLASARARAGSLEGATVVEGTLRYQADLSVLGPVAAVEDPAEARLLLPRVRALGRALAPGPGDGPAPPVDHALLDSLRRAQTPAPLRKSGEVDLGPAARLTVAEKLLDAMADVARWVRDALERIAEFLRKLWPEQKRAGQGGDARPITVAIVAVAASVLGLLALRALRRRGAAGFEVSSSAPAESRHDEDPLSRGASEWERYARELEAAGRIREAIRAWYHAALVTLFRQGTLHYQKGRTNWEYAAQLPPEAPWRPEFVSLTRGFDREWYGRPSSDRDVLRDYAASVRRVLSALGGSPAAS
jgi:hypothetical protein